MLEEKLLFVNFYSSIDIPNYKKYPLPGKNEGVNGSIAGGLNLGINKNIGEGKMKAAIEVVKYLTSERFQKEIIIKQSKLYSGLTKLYDDEECCQAVNCNVIKATQFFHRPSTTMEDYEYFSGKAVEYFQKFLDGQKSIKEVLADIENITKLYYFKMNSILGIIIMVIIILFFVTIAFSLILLYKYKRNYFNFLPIDLWMMYTLGSVFMLICNLEYYNEQNKMKCDLIKNLMVYGNAFIFIPILYRLLVSFPKVNKYSGWLLKNRVIYVISFVIMYLALSLIINRLNTFKIKNINFKNNDLNFQICDYDNFFGKILYIFQRNINELIYFGICFLIFLEWNLTEIYSDLRHITFIMIIDGITLILNMILNSMNINYYMLYSLIPILINLLCVFTNHIYFFVIRVVFLNLFKGRINKEKEMNEIIKNIYVGAGESIESSNIQTSSNITNILKSCEVLDTPHRSRLASFHYSTAPE